MRLLLQTLGCLAASALVACYEPIKPQDSGTPDAEVDSGEPADSGQNRTTFADGAPCSAHGQCASGRCAVRCNGTMYCAKTGCSADSECTLSGSAETFCCSADGVCTSASKCGTRAGTLGAACTAGKDSDCASGYRCLEGCSSAAFCAKPCTAVADCLAERADFTCASISAGGPRFCVPDPDLYGACQSWKDCTMPLACQPALSFDQTSVVTKCEVAPGTTPLGGACSLDEDCASGICWSGEGYRGVCGAVCASDLDCACPAADAGCPSEVCEPFTFYSGSQPFGGAAKLCVDAVRCSDDVDCGAAPPSRPDAGVQDGGALDAGDADGGQPDAGSGATDAGPPRHCVARPSVLGWSTTCALDRTISGGADGVGCQRSSECQSALCLQGACRAKKAGGASCSSAAECLSGVCQSGRCASLCKDDLSCAAGKSCSLQQVPYGSGISGTGALRICQ
ncbi:MAG: hypothetical protein HYZ28_14095 [Myxococcales bacterium]|nr:hypothetical protein [Myxococcales bacterium]